MVGYALGVHAFGYSLYFMGHDELPFLHHPEVPDDVDSGLRRHKGELVEFLVFEEPVRYLYYALFSRTACC